MTAVFRSKLFWALLVFGSLCASFFSYKYFPVALPLVSIDLQMNRDQALQKAQELSQTYSWDASGYRSAATFSTQQDVKIFVELDGGGKPAYLDMIKKGYFEPYQWQVRHFRQYDQQETNIFFTPQGKPYGFEQTFSENTPGTSLDEQAALKLAVRSAQEQWGIDFSVYELVENSKEIRPSGRTDYTFVYQRTDARLNEGVYRLKHMVSGNMFSGLRHEVKIPEEFTLRYQQMRSLNNNIFTVASLAVNILYMLGGCVFGLLFLFRRKYVLWFMPVMAAAFLALLQLLAGINNIPLLWMYYPTALSSQGFLSEYIISLFTKFLQFFLTNALVIMAAESLTRLAFGNHIQFWKLWKPEVADSPEVAGRTFAGYLFVPFALTYLIVFYIITTRYFGWWLPSDELINPDILATYLPWITPFTNALNAGFKEECLFRAVPLSCAVLIGRKRGNLKLWLIIGFIVQIIIFGAAHASYPTQPAYGRLIELIFVSTVFGFIYLKLGLLTAIIMHYVYDVVLMSLPLFVSHAAGALYNQLTIIVLSLIPVFVLLYASYTQGSWKNLASKWYNKEWLPHTTITQDWLRTPNTLVVTFSTFQQHLIYAAGLTGLILWAVFTPFKQNAPTLNVNRVQAIKAAQEALNQRGYNLDGKWSPLTVLAARLEDTNELAHKFVWQTGGEKQYELLLGEYITPPTWVVRFVRFEGTLTERKEEYQVFVNNDKHINRIIHKLPESAQGASLTIDQARKIVYNTLEQDLELDPAQLVEISAVPQKQPNRLDWTFTFSNPQVYKLPTGQARVAVEISGDNVTDTLRYIHIPEDWQRNEQLDKNWRSIVLRISSVIFFLIFMIGIICILRNMANFSRMGLIVAVSVIGVYSILSIFNFLPQSIGYFNSIESYESQWWRLLGLLLYHKMLTVGVLSLIVALMLSARRAFAVIPRTTGALGIGVSLGLAFSGLRAAIQAYVPVVKPVWAEFTPLSGISIPFGTISSIIDRYIIITSILFMALYALDYFTSNWTKHRAISSLLFITAITFLHGYYGIDVIWLWLITGLIYGIMSLLGYILILRHDLGLIPISIGTIMITSALRQQLFNAFPQSTSGTVFACTILLIISIAWTLAFKLQEHPEESATESIRN